MRKRGVKGNFWMSEMESEKLWEEGGAFKKFVFLQSATESLLFFEHVLGLEYESEWKRGTLMSSSDSLPSNSCSKKWNTWSHDSNSSSPFFSARFKNDSHNRLQSDFGRPLLTTSQLPINSNKTIISREKFIPKKLYFRRDPSNYFQLSHHGPLLQ